MQVVAVDIMGPLVESSSGNSYILVAGDYFTNWMEAYPIPNQEATTVAKSWLTSYFAVSEFLNSCTLIKEDSSSHLSYGKFVRS